MPLPLFTDHLTIEQLGAQLGIDLSVEIGSDNQGQLLGKLASSISRDLGIEIKLVPHSVYGQVGSYDPMVLTQLYTQYVQEDSPPISNSSCTACRLCTGTDTVCHVHLPKVADVLIVTSYLPKDGDLVGENYSIIEQVTSIPYFANYHITSALKCSYSGNKEALHKEEVIACKQYLDLEITAVKPKLLITIGYDALYSLTGSSSIAMAKDTISYYEGIPLLAFEPVYPVDDTATYRGKLDLMQGMLTKALYAINHIVKEEEPFTLHKFANTLDEVRELVDCVKQTGFCSFDIETCGTSEFPEDSLNHTRGKITTIAISYQPGIGVVIPFQHFESPYSDEDRKEIVEILNTVFLSREVVKIAHNAKFDMRFLMQAGCRFDFPVYDTMVMDHLLDEEKVHIPGKGLHGLKLCGAQMFPETEGYEDFSEVEYAEDVEGETKEVKKTKKSKKVVWHEVNLELLGKYNAMDTDITLRLFMVYHSRLAKEPELYRNIRNIGNPALLWLLNIEFGGMYMDKEALSTSIIKAKDMLTTIEDTLQKNPTLLKFKQFRDQERWRKELDDLLAKIAKLEGTSQRKRLKDYQDKYTALKTNPLALKSEEFNLGSPSQLADLLYSPEGFGFKPPKNLTSIKEQSERSTSEAVLKELQPLDSSGFIENILTSRGIRKVLNTYLVGLNELLDSNNYLHATFNQHGTKTGRLSASEPNLQNCFSGDVEILTPNGFIRFDQLQKGTPVFQWVKGSEHLEIVIPELVKVNQRELVKLKAPHIDIAVTPDHRCIYRPYKSDALEYLEVSAAATVKRAVLINNSKYTGLAKYPSSAAQLLTYLMHINVRKEGNNLKIGYLHPTIKPYFESLAKDNLFDMVVKNVRDYTLTNFRQDFRIDLWYNEDGTFNHEVLKEIPLDVRRKFIDLVSKQRGTKFKRATFVKQSTMDTYQFLCVISGYPCTVYKTVNTYDAQVGYTDKAINVLAPEPVPGLHTVYCVTVPSSYVMVRSGGNVLVSGNCPRSGPLGSVVKDCFTTPKGYKLMQADLSQAELRIAATMSGDEVMTSAYARKEDLHILTAKNTMGITDAAWEQLPKDARGLYRKKAKAINFGLIYGMFENTLKDSAKQSYGVEFTLEECKKIRINYFNTYPKLTTWHSTYKAIAQRDGFVKTLFGRRRRFPKLQYTVDGKERAGMERQAINSPVQGTGGEYTIFAGCLLRNRLAIFGNGVLFCNTIHDSIMLYIREDLVPIVARIVKQTLTYALTEEYFNFTLDPVGMDADLEVGDRWSSLEEYKINL